MVDTLLRGPILPRMALLGCCRLNSRRSDNGFAVVCGGSGVLRSQ